MRRKAVLYVRTSTPQQDAAHQLGCCRQLAKKEGWEIIGEFVDEAVKPYDDGRQAYNKMLAFMAGASGDSARFRFSSTAA